jgi:flagella basal body P-ring formation protein FlgA
MLLSLVALYLLVLFQSQTGPSACDPNCAAQALEPAQSSDTSTDSAVTTGRRMLPNRHVLEEAEVEFALRAALGGDSSGFKIQILDFSRTPVPAGKVVFDRSGATPPPLSNPEKPFLWRGKVFASSGAEALCWVRVILLVKRNVVRTKIDLSAGELIEPRHLETVQESVCPLLVPADDDVSEYVGLAVKRSLRASSLLTKDLVLSPPLVHRGSRVQVEAISGTTRLSFEAEARSNGYQGQSIALSNVHTGRLFWGKVSGAGLIRVDVSH